MVTALGIRALVDMFIVQSKIWYITNEGCARSRVECVLYDG
jgi:hypothetical protein